MLAPYRLAVGTLRALSPIVSFGSSKLARGVVGRRHAHELLAVWGRGVRDPTRPVVWFHAPSVGEGLQAQAVIGGLLARLPELQVVYTFFSPSAEELGGRMGADVAAYLPWDLRGPVSTALDAIEPDLIVFTKTEVWPVLTDQARRRSIPVAIVVGSLPDGAGRLRGPARAVLRGTWNKIGLACANSDVDTERFIELGVSESIAHTTGDPGIDSALDRSRGADPTASYLAPFREHPRPTLVAGSTWPADEAVLLPALERLRSEIPDLRAVLAPHEPGREQVTHLLARLRESGWRAETLDVFESGDSSQSVDAVVVDRVGVLAHLYAIASVSFVGGGFHDRGLHSVLEPAAARTPVIFGPRHRSARAAADLLARGGAKVVADISQLVAVAGHWLTDEADRDRAGGSAFGYIAAHRGAADRTAVLLDPLIRRKEG
jgi:3-deoxy-D-manno-octulosonic-acid transferase